MQIERCAGNRSLHAVAREQLGDVAHPRGEPFCTHITE